MLLLLQKLLPRLEHTYVPVYGPAIMCVPYTSFPLNRIMHGFLPRLFKLHVCCHNFCCLLPNWQPRHTCCASATHSIHIFASFMQLSTKAGCVWALLHRKLGMVTIKIAAAPSMYNQHSAV